jgi:superfamily II DNA helicase RecQ
MKRIHGEKKPHKCSICDYATAQKKDLKKHINSVHEEGKPRKDKEYFLPFGWKKIGLMAKKSGKTVLDFCVYSPSGQKFCTTKEVTKYLESNPDIQCDRKVTHCQRPKELNKLLSKNNSNLQNEDKENASSGRVLKVKKIKVVETKDSQKLIKNAIKNHKETRSQKTKKKTEKITLITRSIRRNYIEVTEKKTEKITLNTRSIRRKYIKVINILVRIYER